MQMWQLAIIDDLHLKNQWPVVAGSLAPSLVRIEYIGLFQGLSATCDMAKKNDTYVAEQEVQLEEEGNEKNEMVSCIKFRNKMSPGNGDNMSLTNLES